MEKVGVVPRELARQLDLLGHGFTPLGAAERLARLEAAIDFIERGPAEDDPSRKQIIPYAVVCRGPAVFVVERLRGGGEARLHGKLSLGIGGHVNPPLAEAAGGLVRHTLDRELAEELALGGIARIQPKGFINDDSQPVGQVHLGVVFRVDLDSSGAAAVRETHALAGGFRPWSELEPLRPRMETWSVFLLDAWARGQLE